MEPGNENDPSNRRSIGLEKIIAIILLLAGIAIALTLLIGEGLIQRKPKSVPAIPEQTGTPPQPMEPAALTVLEAFFEAPDLTAKAAHVRNGERVRPLMRDFHELRDHPFPTLGRVSPGKAANFNETTMVLFEVEPFSGPRYPVAVVWDGRRFAVDWESLTAYGTIDWSEFIERKPVEPHTLRVYIRAAREADRIPNTPPGSASFLIEHRDDVQPVIAMAGNEIAAALAPLVVQSRAPVTLELAWKPLGKSDVLVPEIVRLVATGWSR